MPAFLIDVLADMSVARALLLSLSLASAASVPVFLFAGARPADFDVRPALRRARDRFRLALVAVLLVAVTHLDPSSAPKKGAL